MPKRCVLVIEDDPFTQVFLQDTLEAEGYQCLCAADGQSAWNLISSRGRRIDAVLLDRGLPDMDGIEILKRIRELPRQFQVPVIVQTSLVASNVLDAGLLSAAYYYLVKPFSTETLTAILTAAIRDHQNQMDLWAQVNSASGALKNLDSAEFSFRSLEEINGIATLVAKATSDPERVVLGLAELMVNAVEHGNLGISYAEKSDFLSNGTWADEVKARLSAPEHASKLAVLKFRRLAGGTSFLVKDQGKGFDWSKYLTINPERMFDLHGRGIALSAASCFDRLEYHGVGNEVEATLNA
jgi:DNA-binding response OmpR family regulator